MELLKVLFHHKLATLLKDLFMKSAPVNENNRIKIPAKFWMPEWDNFFLP